MTWINPRRQEPPTNTLCFFLTHHEGIGVGIWKPGTAEERKASPFVGSFTGRLINAPGPVDTGWIVWSNSDYEVIAWQPVTAPDFALPWNFYQ